MRTLTEQLSEHLTRTVTGPMWHGPALGELLAGVSPEQAQAASAGGAHSIWEIVLHVTVWAEIARVRLRGEWIDDPSPAEDWPPVGPATADDWSTAIDRLHEAHRALASDVAALDEDALRSKVKGLSYTVSNLLHGVVEHGTYHGGQIAILKRQQSGGGPSA